MMSGNARLRVVFTTAIDEATGTGDWYQWALPARLFAQRQVVPELETTARREPISQGYWPSSSPTTEGSRLAVQCGHNGSEEKRRWRVPFCGSREPRSGGSDTRTRAEQQHSDDGTARADRLTGAANAQAFAPGCQERGATGEPTIRIIAATQNENLCQFGSRSIRPLKPLPRRVAQHPWLLESVPAKVAVTPQAA
jgi:hypothetical protein